MYNKCERCGSTNSKMKGLVQKSWHRDESDRIEYFVQCDDCGKSGTRTDTKEKAIQFWNKEK